MGLGGVGSGAAAGATIGSVVPGVGSAIGAGAGALAGLLRGIFGNRSKKKKATNTRAATISGLNIRQKQSEDQRRARLQLGASLLNGVPKTTAGGGVNTNVGLDPELVRALGVERTYDFGSAVPDENVGSGDAFLSGLFGAVQDTIPYMVGGGHGAPAGGMGAGMGGSVDAGAGAGGGIAGAGGMSIEDLMQFLNTRKAADGTAPPVDNWSE